MKYIVFGSLLLAFVLAVCFSACTKESTDHIYPSISDIRLSIGDTIIYKETPASTDSTIIHINDSINFTSGSIDTLILGHKAYISLKLSDNESLSTYFVTLLPEDEAYRVDTLYSFQKLGSTVFGKTQVEVIRHDLVNVDSVFKYTNKNSETKTIGTQGKYDIEVKCTDVYGNMSDRRVKVQLLSRDSILKLRGY